MSAAACRRICRVDRARAAVAALSERGLDAYLDKVKLEKFTPNTVTSKVRLRGIIEETRRQGWSIVDQELEVGLRVDLRADPRPGRRDHAALNVCCPRRA